MSKNSNIAVYWDFENIHISLCSLLKGESWYRKNFSTKQPELININSMMDYISGLGEININKAYANWSFFHSYSFNLQNHSIDLIQMFPRGKHGKNGADIRLAIDILEDCMLKKHIDCIVLISGDSDYISIAQKIRQNGKKIVGIGIQETTNQFWIKACNEFKFYSSVVKDNEIINADKSEEFDINDAKILLKKSLNMLFAETGNNFTYRVKIKPIMLRLDPSFDETNHGVSNFTDFLYKCNDIVKLDKTEKDLIVSFSEDNIAIDDESIYEPTHLYERILKRLQIRLVKPYILTTGLKETFKIFSKDEKIKSYKDYREKLFNALNKSYPDVQDSDTAKIKAMIYKAFCFQIDFESKTILLSDDIKSDIDLIDSVYQMIIKRILDNIDDSHEIDTNFLSQILYGDRSHKSDIFELIADYNNRASR